MTIFADLQYYLCWHRWVGLKKPNLCWLNTWMVPNLIIRGTILYLSIARLAWILISIIFGIGTIFDSLLIFGAWRKKVWAVHLWNVAQVILCSFPCCALIPYTNKMIDEFNEEIETVRQQPKYSIISNHLTEEACSQGGFQTRKLGQVISNNHFSDE